MSSEKDEKKLLLERVLRAREAVGLSLSEAAKLLGFKNYQTLSSIEKGTRNINANELSAMASLYGRRLDYFFVSPFASDPIPLWRKKPEADINQIQRRFRFFLENYSNLEYLFSLRRRWKDIQKGYDKSDFSTDGFKLAVRLGAELCDSLNLGSRPASNLLNVLENVLRFKILHLPLDNGVSGGSVLDETLGVGILINANDAPLRRNFDLAHELFHVLTWNVFSHKEVGDGSIRTKPEQYADAFASSLLLPESPLRDSLDEITFNNRIKMVDIIELAKEYGVSTEAILWRLVNLGVLKKSVIEEAIKNPELRKVDQEMRRALFFDGEPSKFPERYISLACRALIEGRISRGTFATYLEIDRTEVDGFLKREGFIDKNYEKIDPA